MKKLSGHTWTGIIFVAAGFAFGACVIYVAILIDHPVSMPMSLVAGEVRTPEFRIYTNKFYNIYVEVNKRLPLEVLDCMMGVSTGPLDPFNCKKGEEPLLQANWTLWSDGLIVDQGSSDDYKGMEGGEMIPFSVS